MKRMVGTVLVVLAALAAPAASAPAAGLQLLGNFSEPVFVTSDPGNPNRLFVVQRAGKIMQVENGVVTEFANLEPQVSCCSGEQGLLSVAFSPDFASSGRLFVDYTGRESPWPEIHVAELRASGATATFARDLLRIPHPNQNNHYGGQLQFGPEGLLFVGTGDGGGGNDPEHNAQKLEGAGALLGKILRIGVDSSGLLPYTVPAGNPFPAAAAPYNTIFASGLRNPYRFSFDRQSHDLVIGDVGEAAREEIDWAPAPGLGAGANYGWNCREGSTAGPATDPGCTPLPPAGTFTEPVFDYPHANGAQAIIGGYVARDPSLPELGGRYLYGDFGNGAIRSLVLSEAVASDRSEGLSVPGLDSFGEDSCGRLYAVSRSGPVYRLVGPSPNTCTPPAPPPIVKPLAPSTVAIRAVTRRVKRNGRAQISVWVSPCKGRQGEAVQLRRGAVRLGSRRLDRACTAHFLPRVTQPVQFEAEVRADQTYVAAVSRKLGVRVYRPTHEVKKHSSRLHIPAGVGRR